MGTVSWWLYPNSYIGDDPLFYLVVARNMVFSGIQSFSGIFPTNGVHPLWQYLLAGFTYVSRGSIRRLCTGWATRCRFPPR